MFTSFYTEFFPSTLRKNPSDRKVGRGGCMRRSAVLHRLQASNSRLQGVANNCSAGSWTTYRNSIVLTAILVLFTMVLAGCGGGKKTDTSPKAVNVNPTSLSLNLGDVRSVSGTVVDSSGNAVSNPPTISFASSNTAVVSVSSTGLVCAGTWDANFIVCDASHSQPGTANINVTAGALTAAIPVFTHLHVDRVTISPAKVDCSSSGQTQQLTAQAFSNGVDITSTVGAFTWGISSTDVATVDSNGVVTAKTPGQTSAFASVSAVLSVPTTWVTCPVQSLRIHVANSTDTSFSLAAVGNTSTLAADVVDSHGLSVTVPLNWSSSQPAVATVNGAGVATAVAAGATGITATCAATCNLGLSPVYSNVVTGAVAGTSATTIYATGTGTTSLVPIDSGTNVVGTAITLPSSPNSFLFSPQGAKGYLGSSAGVITLDTVANTVSQTTSVPGTVLAVSPDGNRVIVAGSNLVTVLGVGSGISTEASSITGATAADFAPDSRAAYVVAGSTVYFWMPGSFRSVTLSGTANDVKFLANGAFAYVAGGGSGPAVTARATCNNALADTVTTPAVPSFVRTLPDASAVLAVDSPGIDVIRPTTSLVGCPPPLSDALTTVDLGAGAFTARQLIVLPDGSKAFVTSNLGTLLGLKASDLSLIPVTLATGAAALTGGSTLDSKMVYVGGSDNAVHRIDTTAGTDAQQIGVSFTPDLVAVKPK